MLIKAIDPKDLLIYICLRRYYNPVTGEASVSIANIAKLTGVSPVTILNSLERLETAGYIKYVKRGRQNFYVLMADIEATSYDFLDTNLSKFEKINEALKVIKSTNNSKVKQIDNKVYDYIVTLEKNIINLKEQINILVSEINSVQKCMSVITGQPYTPLDLT